MEQTQFLGAYNNFDAYTGDLFDKLLKATKAANGLPDADNFKYYLNYPPFRGSMNNVGQRLLDLTQKFLDFEKGEKAPLLNVYDDSEDVLEQFDSVIDVVDTLIEKVDSFADEARGDPHHKSSIVIAKTKTSSFSNRNEETHVVFGNNIARPQIKFEDKIDNSNRPWVPLTKLPSKPNALKPLYKLEEFSEFEEDLEFSYPHPYDYEINKLQYNEKQLTSSKEIPPGTLEATPFTWVDTVPQLEKLALLLDKEEEIAIDLENHNYRSFQGFTCLMQISTRKEDFVIDTLLLRNKMHILNSSFTNPSIVKVLHGADSDVVWLQRDFGLYLVNLFDTGQATRVLEFPKFSLAYLLSHYCNVLADKKYQLADWRIRPIPEEMLRYAREDTHYLLYIYDKLKNQLIAQGNQTNNLLLSVLNRSKELCLKKYEKEKYLKDSHLILYNKFNLIFNGVQMNVFAGLFKWRDTVAREQDESIRFVLPNHMLFKISEVLPSDPSSLLQCCSPVPPLVKTYTMEILSIINEAKKEKLTAPTLTTNPYASPLKDLSSTISTGNSSGMYQSPVLTTDQLYTAAGWLEDEFHWTPRSKYNIIMPNLNENFESSQPFVTTLFLNSFKEDEEDDEDEQLQIYRDRVAKIQSSITDSMINARAPPELFKSFDQSTAKAQSTTTTTTTQESTKKAEATLEDVNEEEPLPQSMAEIYKLSNQIKRKRNKEKKKLKQEQVNQEDDQVDDDEEEEEDKSLRNKKLKGEGKVTDPVEFMKEIGWVDKQQQQQQQQYQQQAPSSYGQQQQQQSGGYRNNQGNQNRNNSNSNNNYQRKGNYQNFTPYDYSQNQQQQYQQQQQQPNQGTGGNRGGYFNPYANPTLPVKQTNKKGSQNNNRGKAWKPNKQ